MEDRISPLKLYKEGNSKVLISILVDIAFKNPRTYPIIIAILSKILSLETKSETIIEIMNSIEKKFDRIPNVGHFLIWLQRLTIKIDRYKNYSESLCQKVNNKDINIWDISWLNKDIQQVFYDNSIINDEDIDKLDKVIAINEVTIFNKFY